MSTALADWATTSARFAPTGDEEIRRMGDYWSITFTGDQVLLRHSKGLEYLATLLAAPGHEIHVLDLTGDGSRGGAEADGADEILDRRARDAYRRRLLDLAADREEAAGNNDLGRVERIDGEIEFLVAELSGAMGLTGRSRRTVSASERARQAVTKSIRAAMSRIDDVCPALGAHLDATVRTGTYCSYRPDPRLAVSWQG